MPSYPKKIGKPKFGFTSGRKIDSSWPRQQTLYCPRDLGSITCVLFSEASERASNSFFFFWAFFLLHCIHCSSSSHEILHSVVSRTQWEECGMRAEKKIALLSRCESFMCRFFLLKCSRTIRRSFFCKCIRCIANFVDKLSRAFINNNNGSMEAIKYAFPTWPA